MAETKTRPSMDPNTGYCYETGVYTSLRPPVALPPADRAVSAADYCLSHFRSTSTDGATAFVVNATTGQTLTYSQLLSQINSLAYSLQKRYSLSQNDVAYVLSPPSLHVPVLYFALLSLGVVVSPANPLSSESEIAHQIRLCKPVIAFATCQTSRKLPPLKRGTVVLDSPEFLSLLTHRSNANADVSGERVSVRQSDSAAILYSSGTTGRVKGVVLTHRNLTTIMAFIHNSITIENAGNENPPPPVTFITVPFFHVFGFMMLLGAVVGGRTVVMTERFEFEEMLKAVEKYRITGMPVSPPLVLALVKSDLTKKYDLSSLAALGCGGAPLGKELAQQFNEKFPNVVLAQVSFH